MSKVFIVAKEDGFSGLLRTMRVEMKRLTASSVLTCNFFSPIGLDVLNRIGYQFTIDWTVDISTEQCKRNYAAASARAPSKHNGNKYSIYIYIYLCIACKRSQK